MAISFKYIKISFTTFYFSTFCVEKFFIFTKIFSQKPSPFLFFRHIKYVKKNPDRNLPKLVDFLEKFVGKIFPAENFQKMRNGISDDENVWKKLVLKVIDETDENVINKMILAFGLGAGLHGTKEVRAEMIENLYEKLLPRYKSIGFDISVEEIKELYDIK